MPRWIYTPPYSLLDLLGLVLVVALARITIPPVLTYSFSLHAGDRSITWIEIVLLVGILLGIVFLVARIIEPIRHRISKAK